MARVNITLPDELAARARSAGLNVSRLAASALESELERRTKLARLEAYLADLRNESGPVPADEAAAAAVWADQFTAPPATARSGRGQSAG